jgi:hypothetical protein
VFNGSGLLLSASKTDITGTCSLDIGNNTGPIIVRVCGGTNVTYFDETLAIPVNVPMSASDCLLAASPSAPTGGSPKIGVTPLTHLGAVLAGIDPNSSAPKASGSIADANAKVKVAILGKNESFDILDAPSPPKFGSKVSGDDKAIRYGAFIAALSKQIVVSGFGGSGTLFQRFNALATEFKNESGTFKTDKALQGTLVTQKMLQAAADAFFDPLLVRTITNQPGLPTGTGTGTGTGTATGSSS